MSYVLVYTTAANAEEARRVGDVLVAERLAACTNVSERIESVYWWQGELERDQEAALIAKTREDLLDRVVARVKEVHAYDCPCVVAFPIIGGNPEYLD